MLLRWTLGAQRRIAADFGSTNLKAILDKYDFGAVPRLVFHCAYDAQGNPPEGMTASQFEESFPGDQESGQAALSALLSATTQGKVTKNDMEARVSAELEKSRTGSNSGASAANASDSPTPNSGTSTQPSSSPSPDDSTPTKGSIIIDPE